MAIVRKSSPYDHPDYPSGSTALGQSTALTLATDVVPDLGTGLGTTDTVGAQEKIAVFLLSGVFAADQGAKRRRRE